MARVTVKLICWFFFIILLKGSAVRPQPEKCERSHRGAAAEGLLGSVRAFPWLGVLRVHLHDGKALKLALTGLVLVKEKFAIASADDIAKIPKRIFQEDSRAMFIGADRAPWFCRPVDYMTHPEYELETLNTIALVELEPPPDTRDFPMKPVCWPSYSYNITNNLYAVGYTDENQLLEKFSYKLQYVDQHLCREFYTRAGLTEGMMAPLHYECGFATNNKESCVWDNGMALVSNSSGHWVLIGLGIQGPGCAAPARFLALAHYYQWIESSTNVQEIEEANYRKSAFNKGFKRPEKIMEYIPAHELLRSTANGSIHEKHDFAHYYPFDTNRNELEDPFQINRINATQIQIQHISRDAYMFGRHGNCDDKELEVMYSDVINVSAWAGKSFMPPPRGTVRYKMSLHDSLFDKCTCVTIKLYVKQTRPAYLYYDKVMEDATLFPENPDEIIRVYPFHTQTKLLNKTKLDHLKPVTVTAEGKNFTAYNVVLYLKIVFEGACQMEISFYGPPAPIVVPTLPANVTSLGNLSAVNTTPDPYNTLRRYEPMFLPALAQSRDNWIEEEVVYNDGSYVKSYTTWVYCIVILSFL